MTPGTWPETNYGEGQKQLECKTRSVFRGLYRHQSPCRNITPEASCRSPKPFSHCDSQHSALNPKSSLPVCKYHLHSFIYSSASISYGYILRVPFRRSRRWCSGEHCKATPTQISTQTTGSLAKIFVQPLRMHHQQLQCAVPLLLLRRVISPRESLAFRR